MRIGELEQLFLRFRKDGDANALGEVFDRTAPELLRLASHLTHGAAHAEDLVQETFVTAIERAERWDSRRKLLPWLIGILSIESRRLRGRRTESDALGEPRTDEPAPADVAEERELAHELRQAIEELPAPYRDVLRMHLREGKGSHEIARELDRAPGTVRVQVHRAFELLRRILPPSAALSVAALATAPRGLAAVRAEVCRVGAGRFAELAATGAASLVPRTALSGWLVMNKWTVLGVSLVASLLVWITNPFARSPLVPAADERVVTAAGELAAPDPRDRASLESRVTTRERTEPAMVAREGQPLEALATAPPRIRGRVTFERDGSVADDVTVRLEHRSESGPAIHVVESRTNEGGEFEFTRLDPGETWLVADRGGVVIVQVDDESDEWVDLAIPGGVDVEGVVLDEHGSPLARAEILLTYPWRLKETSSVTTADEKGRFEIECVGAGCGIGAVAPGYTRSRVELVNERLAADASRPFVEIRLAPSRARITGTVTDAGGRAIEDAEVLLGRFHLESEQTNDGTSSYSPPHQRARTTIDGTFELTGVLPRPQNLSIRALGWAIFNVEVIVEENETTHIDVGLERGARVHGTVRSGDGRPTAGVEVLARRPTLFPNNHVITDPEGRYALENVPVGEIEMIAHSRAGTSREFLFIAPDSEVEWSCTLVGTPPIEGRAVDESGKPLEGWWVIAHPARLVKGRSWNETDAEGRFRIDNCKDGVFDLKLCDVLDVSGIPHATTRGVRPGDGSILLRIDPETRPSSTLSGKLVDTRDRPIVLGRLRLEAPRQHASLSADSDAAGLFRFGPLSPGDYRLRVEAREHYDALLGTFTVGASENIDAGVFRLTEPGSLDVTVVDEANEPVSEFSAELFDNGWEQRALEIDPGGRIRASTLYAAPHVLVVRAPGHATHTREIAVTSGEATRARVQLEKGIDHEIAFELASDEPAPSELVLRVRDVNGHEVDRRLWRNRIAGERIEAVLTLLPGTYECILVAPDIEYRSGRTIASAHFEVDTKNRRRTELALDR